MNALFTRGVTAIQDCWHRNFQSAEDSTDAGKPGSGNGRWSRFFSAARFLTAPAPMIQRPITPVIANTGMGADMDANKAKPSIVRVIRVIRVRRRRPRPAGESRFLSQFGARRIANS
jgi:hypothetical protein